MKKGEERGPDYVQECGPLATPGSATAPESQPWHDPWIPTCFTTSSVPGILALLQKFLRHVTCEEESRPPHKHHHRLVVLYIPFLTTKVCRVIQFPYGFRCKNVKTKYWDVGKIKIQKRWRLVIWADVLFVNAMFCNGRMRWEVVKNQVVSRCRLSGMLMDNNN